MKKIIISFFCFLFFLALTSPIIYAQGQNVVKQDYFKAEVKKIVQEGEKIVGDKNNLFQKLELKILEGPDKDKNITIEHGGVFVITNEQKVNVGETVILTKTGGQTEYRIADRYRLNNLLFIFIGFFLLVIIIAGKKGFGSFLGMLISLAVIVFFIIPQILNGANPLLISMLGSLFIMITTIYLAHGFSSQTTIAILATAISLLITVLLSILFVDLTMLSGLGSEDIYSLFQGLQGKVNFQGLLLGGIIIGTLGVLDDVTTTQTATLFTLAHANPKVTLKELFSDGMKIGREHITSLVNTLVLAYAGASIGVFIFLILGLRQQAQPLWMIINSEFIVEEIIRTLVGSIALILAVPITTLLASFFAKYSLKIR